jgi:hypothetical protein
MDCLEMEQSGLAFANASCRGTRRVCDCERLFSELICARWRRMVGLNKNARPLLSMVKGKPHATSKDHETDNKPAPDSAKDDSNSDSDDDDDDDNSVLGILPGRKPTRLRVPPRTYSNPSSSVVPAKREAEAKEELDTASFTSSSSQSKRPKNTFSKKPSFIARNKVVRQEKTG